VSKRRSGSTVKSMAIKDPMAKAEMIQFTDKVNIPTSLTKMHNPENINLACSIFKDLYKCVFDFYRLVFSSYSTALIDLSRTSLHSWKGSSPGCVCVGGGGGGGGGRFCF
jgi:hypothetical protein